MVAVLLVPAVVFGATTVGNDVSVGGTLDVTGATTITNVSSTNHSASGYLDVNGATTLDGAVTLGDSAGDSITITGKLGQIYIADGTTTSTIAKNSFIVAQAANFNVGKFYVDSSGNVSASGTLGITGLFTPTGGISTSTLDGVVVGGSTAAAGSFVALSATGATTLDGNVTLGNAVTDSITATGFFLDTISVGDGAAVTSTLNNDSFSVAKNATNNVGKFYVDSSGSISASGTIQTLQLATSTIIIDTNDATKGTCFVVRDVAGTAKYMTILAGNTVAISTKDCRL